MIKSLEKFFVEVIKLPKPASDWLLELFNSIQILDDLMDGDHVDSFKIDHLIWNTLVTMPSNDFFIQKRIVLIPAIMTAILKWRASNYVELIKDPSAMSFSWRAGYYDIVLLVCCLCHGEGQATAVAPDIMRLYGEKFEDYIKEISDA